MGEREDEKRRRALQRLRDLRGQPRPAPAAPARPEMGMADGSGRTAGRGALLQQLLESREAGAMQASAGRIGVPGRGALLRQILAARAGGATGGEMGPGLRHVLEQGGWTDGQHGPPPRRGPAQETGGAAETPQRGESSGDEAGDGPGARGTGS